MEVVVGLDSGTTATKAVTAGADGRVRDVARVGYRLQVPAPGRAELDPHRLRSAAVAALAAVVEQARSRGDHVVGVSLSAAMHGLVPMDDDGTPRGPLVTWADDRAAARAAALVKEGRAADLHRRTGTPVHPMSPMVKLAHAARTDPELVAGTPRWGGVKELVVTALCGGAPVVDVSCAAATGMLALTTRDWDDEALQVAGVRRDQLADVLPTTALLRLAADVAGAVGLPAGTPVVVGAADGVLATLGVGALGPGVAAVSLGTSGALRAVVARPVTDAARALFCYPLTEDRWVVGGAVNNGGSVVRWAAQALAAPVDAAGSDAGGLDAGGPDDDDSDDGAGSDAVDRRLVAEAATVAPGSDRLLCLPHLLGERAPWWRTGMHGAYIGLRREHTRAHLVRAAVEGVCQQLALVRDAVTAAGLPVREVRATGGAVAAPLWVQTLADALDAPVAVAPSAEGTGLGAALLGLHALGVLPDVDAAARLVVLHQPVEPDPQAAALHRRRRPLVERAVDVVAELTAELDRL